MAKILLASVLLLLIASIQARTIYYPDTKDPNAIVFDGPTNYKGPQAKEIADNEVETTDYSNLIDIRAKSNVDETEATVNACPAGFVMIDRGLCFPND